MRKVLLGGVALVAMAIPLAANAADLSRPAPVYTKAPPPIPVTTWTGFYLGIYGGGGAGFARFDNVVLPGFSSGNFTTSGGMFGGTGGFNFQNGPIVFGVEADGGWDSMRGSTGCPTALPIFTCIASETWLSTVRGRVGWAAGSNVLLYATGGGAFGDVRAQLGPIPVVTTADRAGWSAGAGIEWMFAPNWSLKAEYLHYDLGTLNCGFLVCTASPTVPTSVRFAADTGKVGINYHFNWSTLGRY